MPVPLAWGILRPVVVLPEAAARWPEARIRVVLWHELTHIRRYDLAAQLLGQVACCLYWFQPLAWMAARRLRQERELACDDVVLAAGVPPHEYAADLVDLARGLAGRRRAWVSTPAMAEACDLESRVRALFDRSRNRRPLGKKTVWAIEASMLAVLLPIASVVVQAQADRGSLAGVVMDPSGARVPGTRVTANHRGGTNKETTRSNAAGEYRFNAVPAGEYVLEFGSPGFALTKVAAAVAAGQTARVDATLELGSVSELITIAGQKPPTVTPNETGTRERIRVGGNVQPVKLIRQVRPDYPADLQQLGVQGTVVIRAVISKDGDVLSPQVVSASADARLAQLALDAVKQWRYQPSLLNGQPVETATTVTIDFALDSHVQ
jgi:TonB family protein